MSIILPNLNHSFISPVPVPVPVPVPDPDFRVFHTPFLIPILNNFFRFAEKLELLLDSFYS